MSPAQPRTWPAPIRALRHRNFQIYFAGQGLSTLGKWIQQVALSWLAYHLTGSAVLLGTIAFLTLLPQLLLGPVAGAWADRHDKRRLLIGVQAILAVQSLALAVMTWQQWMGTETIIAMALILGLLNSLETPLRQALISGFVGDPADLPNALVLNAMLINAARFIGPPLAGFLITWHGEAGCFLLTAVAFAMLLIGLVKVQSAQQARASGSTGEMFREGLRYLWGTLSVRRLLLTVVMVNLFASCYAVLLPILAKNVFAGDAQTLGWLWGAAGAGAFLATLFLAFAASSSNLHRVIVGGTLTCAVSLCAVAANLPLLYTLIALAGLGFGITVSNVSTNMTLQSSAPDLLRGRVIAFYIAMRFGFEAIGGLLAGLIAAWLSVQWTLAIAGVSLLVYQGVVWQFGARRAKAPSDAGSSAH